MGGPTAPTGRRPAQSGLARPQQRRPARRHRCLRPSPGPDQPGRQPVRRRLRRDGPCESTRRRLSVPFIIVHHTRKLAATDFLDEVTDHKASPVARTRTGPQTATGQRRRHLIKPLTDAEVNVTQPSTSDVAFAHGTFLDKLTAGRLRRAGQPELDAVVRVRRAAPPRRRHGVAAARHASRRLAARRLGTAPRPSRIRST